MYIRVTEMIVNWFAVTVLIDSIANIFSILSPKYLQPWTLISKTDEALSFLAVR